MRLRVAWGACALGLSCATLAGCRSAVSTHVTPDPYCGGWATKKIRGVPVTVRVPTHLEVRVVEKRSYANGSDKLLAAVREVRHEMREKDQLFTVDSVRPAAGKLTYKAGFENKLNPQFFSSFDAKIEDTTVTTIGDIVPTLPKVLENLKGAKAKSATGFKEIEGSGAKLFYVEHLVAVHVFDVNDPNLTACVQGFLDLHLNSCPSSCPLPPVP